MDDAKLKSLDEHLSQEPIILNFEGFIIRPLDGWNLWMEAPSGEGAAIRKIEFLVLLDKFFKKVM